MKSLFVLLISSLLLVLAGCVSAQTPASKPIASSVSIIKQSQTTTDHPSNNSVPNALGSMNLNAAAFKNMGDLAFVWQGMLWLLDGKTGETRQLSNSVQAFNPIWSYDGQWIAFIRPLGLNAATGQLWLVRRDGQEAHQVKGITVPVYGRSFSWSPKDDILAVSEPDKGLWLVPVNGTPHLEVGGSLSFSPCWSPDGKSIAYSVTLPYDANKPENRSDALYTLTVSNGEVIKLLTIPNAGIDVAGWWTDSRGLLYWVDPDHSASIAADGLYLWSLPFGKLEPKRLLLGLESPGWLSISAKGQLLMVTGGGRIIWTEKSLATINPESGSTQELPNPAGCVAIDPSFSPDGNSIAFVTAKNLGKNIVGFDKPDGYANWVTTRTLWIENANGSGSHPLKSAGQGVYQPTWSKSGNHILYAKNNSLWIVKTNGENPEKVLGPFPDWQDQFSYSWYNQES